jgi:membrane protein YdbS with pleckstrin-like domain
VERKRSDVRGSARDRGEKPSELLDRNVGELLQETRVATAGVQFLFAFLLTLPFTQRFSSLTRFDTTLYTLTLLSTALAALVLLAPVAYHRVLFRQHEKDALVAFADRALLVGLALLLVGITSAVLLVLDVVLGRWPAVAGSGLIAVVGLGTWFLLPWRHRSRADG